MNVEYLLLSLFWRKCIWDILRYIDPSWLDIDAEDEEKKIMVEDRSSEENETPGNVNKDDSDECPITIDESLNASKTNVSPNDKTVVTMDTNKNELNNESKANVAQSGGRYCYIKPSERGNVGNKSKQKDNNIDQNGKEDQPLIKTEKERASINDQQTDIYSLD